MSRDVKMQGAGDSQGAGGHDGEADAPRAAPAQAPDHLKIDDWISEGEIEGGDFNTAGEARRWGEQHLARVIDHASFADLMEGVLFVGEDGRAYALDIRAVVVEVGRDTAPGMVEAEASPVECPLGCSEARTKGPRVHLGRPAGGRRPTPRLSFREKPGEHFGRAGVSAPGASPAFARPEMVVSEDAFLPLEASPAFAQSESNDV